MPAEKIVKVVYKGLIPTKDIEVNSDKHIFYGNGIATSNSHSVSYAIVGYWTAWIKHHFPLQFYTSWLTFAKHKPKPKDEIRELVCDAKYNGITVLAPNLSMKPLPTNFTIYQKNIYFGLRDIKGIGEAMVKKLNTVVGEAEKKYNSNIEQWTWFQFLYRMSDKLSKTVVQNMICVGGLDFFNESRRLMLFEYNTWSELTDREKKIINEHDCSNLLSALSILSTSKITDRRLDVIKNLIETLENPPSQLDDSPLWINKIEQSLLGIPLTVTSIGGEAYDVDTTCREFEEGKEGTIILKVNIVNAKETTIKNGQNKGEKMAFIEVEDDTGKMDNVVAFTDIWKDYQNILYRGNSVVITGSRSKSRKESFVLSKVRQI